MCPCAVFFDVASAFCLHPSLVIQKSKPTKSLEHLDGHNAKVTASIIQQTVRRTVHNLETRLRQIIEKIHYPY